MNNRELDSQLQLTINQLQQLILAGGLIDDSVVHGALGLNESAAFPPAYGRPLDVAPPPAQHASGPVAVANGHMDLGLQGKTGRVPCARPCTCIQRQQLACLAHVMRPGDTGGQDHQVNDHTAICTTWSCRDEDASWESGTRSVAAPACIAPSVSGSWLQQQVHGQYPSAAAAPPAVFTRSLQAHPAATTGSSKSRAASPDVLVTTPSRKSTVQPPPLAPISPPHQRSQATRTEPPTTCGSQALPCNGTTAPACPAAVDLPLLSLCLTGLLHCLWKLQPSSSLMPETLGPQAPQAQPPQPAPPEQQPPTPPTDPPPSAARASPHSAGAPSTPATVIAGVIDATTTSKEAADQPPPPPPQCRQQQLLPQQPQVDPQGLPLHSLAGGAVVQHANSVIVHIHQHPTTAGPQPSPSVPRIPIPTTAAPCPAHNHADHGPPAEPAQDSTPPGPQCLPNASSTTDTIQPHVLLSAAPASRPHAVPTPQLPPNDVSSLRTTSPAPPTSTPPPQPPLAQPLSSPAPASPPLATPPAPCPPTPPNPPTLPTTTARPATTSFPDSPQELPSHQPSHPLHTHNQPMRSAQVYTSPSSSPPSLLPPSQRPNPPLHTPASPAATQPSGPMPSAANTASLPGEVRDAAVQHAPAGMPDECSPSNRPPDHGVEVASAALRCAACSGACAGMQLAQDSLRLLQMSLQGGATWGSSAAQESLREIVRLLQPAGTASPLAAASVGSRTASPVRIFQAAEQQQQEQQQPQQPQQPESEPQAQERKKQQQQQQRQQIHSLGRAASATDGAPAVLQLRGVHHAQLGGCPRVPTMPDTALRHDTPEAISSGGVGHEGSLDAWQGGAEVRVLLPRDAGKVMLLELRYSCLAGSQAGALDRPAASQQRGGPLAAVTAGFNMRANTSGPSHSRTVQPPPPPPAASRLWDVQQQAEKRGARKGGQHASERPAAGSPPGPLPCIESVLGTGGGLSAPWSSRAPALAECQQRDVARKGVNRARAVGRSGQSTIATELDLSNFRGRCGSCGSWHTAAGGTLGCCGQPRQSYEN